MSLKKGTVKSKIEGLFSILNEVFESLCSPGAANGGRGSGAVE